MYKNDARKISIKHIKKSQIKMYEKLVIPYLYIVFFTATLLSAGLSMIDRSLYIGCFKDKENDRDIPTNISVTDVTPQKCIDACLARDSSYRYAAMQWGRECLCGSYAGKWATLPEGSCSYACFGDDSQMCGGWFSNTLYLTKIPVAEEGDYIGCFRDETNRDLDGYGLLDVDRPNNTPETCINICRTQGFLYAGVQVGHECFCGDYYGRYGAARDSDCSASCTGDGALNCGGFWRNSIYSTGCFQAPTCTNQYNGSIIDTHPIGDELFTVHVPDPDVYFTGQYFAGLSFAIENSTLDVASIDPSTGRINTTGNITVFPSYPTKNFSIVVQVGNTQSCGNIALCTMTLEVAFKNWPIEIDTDQVPANVTVDEDSNERKPLITIYTSDGNAADQDNVTCILSNNPDPTLIELVHDGNHAFNSYSVWKQECTVPGCGVLCKGCLESRAIAEYDIEIQCFDAYGSSDSHSLKLMVKENEPPTLLNLPGTVNASNTDNLGEVIFSTSVNNLPINESIEFKLQSRVGASYELGTVDLFSLNVSNGEVYINSDPSQEFSQTFEMTICVKDKRHEVCANLTINFPGCFQAPTCTNQYNGSIIDTHPIGDELFTVHVPDPDVYFTGQYFAGLSFAIENSTLDVASIDPSTGRINTTGNITVFPSYPSKNFSIVVQVGNTQSCGNTALCTMTLEVAFKNWPIEIDTDQVPANVTVDEDSNERKPLITIYTLDGNAADQDNVTCILSNNPDPSLIELVHDGNHAFNSYSVWKQECTVPGCGVLCKGCLESRAIAEYDIEIQCFDAYGSSDSHSLKLMVKENEPPTLLNLPGTVNASNTDNLGEVIFSTSVNNLPINESIEFKLQSRVGASYELGTVDLFSLNVSNGEVYINSDPSQEFSQTFEMTICVKDTRHEVCANLTINFHGCFQTPTCNDQSNFTFSDTHQVEAVLFIMDVPVPTGVFSGQTFSGLQFSIEKSSLDVATINTTTGAITTTGTLTVDSSHPSQNFSISVRVGNSESCDHTSMCTMALSVSSANWQPISIDNLPAEVTISEDDEDRLHLKTIDTNLPAQDVTCSIASDAGSTLFEMVHDIAASPHTHAVWKTKCPGASCLDHHIVPKYVIVVTCSDSYGNSDTKNLTVIVADEPTEKSEFVNIIFVTTLTVGVVLVLAIIIGCVLKNTQSVSVIQPTPTTNSAAHIPNGAPAYSSITNQPRAAIVETGDVW